MTRIPRLLLDKMHSDVTQRAMRRLRVLTTTTTRLSDDDDGGLTFDDVMKSLVYEYLQNQGLSKTMETLLDETKETTTSMLQWLDEGDVAAPTSSSSSIPTHLMNWPSKNTSRPVLTRKRWRGRPTVAGTGGIGGHQLLSKSMPSSSTSFALTHAPLTNVRVSTLSGRKRPSSSSVRGSSSSSKRIKRSSLSSALPDQLLEFDAKFQASISSPVSSAGSSRRSSRSSSKRSSLSSLSSSSSNKKERHITFHLKRPPLPSSTPGSSTGSGGAARRGSSLETSSHTPPSLSSSITPSVLVGIVQHGLWSSTLNDESSDTMGSTQNNRTMTSAVSSHLHGDNKKQHRVLTSEKKNFAHALRSRVFINVDMPNRLSSSSSTSSSSSSNTSSTSSYRSRKNHDTLIVSHGDQHMMSQRARSMVFSHFRHMRSYRDEMNRFTCSSFLSRLGDQPKHMLVAGQESGSCAFINMWTTDVMFELDAHTSSIDAVWTSMNQRLVLTNGADGEMKLWDATRPMIGGSATSKPTGLKLHSTYEECFNPQFSHDSRSIVSSHVVHEASNLPASIQIGQRYRTTVHDVETKKTAQIL